MSGSRIALILLQVAGGISLIPYPFILIANIMSIGAPHQTLLGALPFIALSVYPVIWILLYVFAWRAITTGRPGLAFSLSGIPVLASLCMVGYFAYDTGASDAYNKKAASEIQRKIEPINPVLWAVYSAGGKDKLPSVPTISPEDAIKVIDANPSLVNIVVLPYGTPLKNALLNLWALHLDGTIQGDPSKAQGLMRIVRSLVAHGAVLEPEERRDIGRTWQLRRALYDGPVTTEQDNPLVWKIIKLNSSKGETFKLSESDKPWLNQPTRLNGSPLYAALLVHGYDIFPILVNAGARLTPEEEQDPAAVKALDEMLARSPELQKAYRR